MIYHAIVEDSITPDLWDDIPQVTNVLGVFLQDSVIWRELIHDMSLVTKLNIFLEETSDEEEKIAKQEKNVTHERPEYYQSKL